MKFPKIKAQIISIVEEYSKAEDYQAIYHLHSDILDNIEQLKDTKVLDTYIEAVYLLGDNDKVILITDEYLRCGYESYKVIYYNLLALISNIDIYQAVNYIKRSELLRQEEVKSFYISDGANYLNILLTDKLSLNMRLALIIVNFVLGISKEMLGEVEVDKKYLLYRFFDLINIIYEIGYDDDIVLKLSDDMKNIFMLEI